MIDYGRTQLSKTGRDVRCIADGNYGRVKSGGISLSLATIPLNLTGSNLVLPDDSIVIPNAAYMRYGQTLAKITTGEIDTVTITGVPTGGTFTITVGGQTTSALAFNAAAATVQAALVLLSTVGTGNATVSGTAPYVITFASSLGALTVTASGASLTGGTSPAATAARTTNGAELGKFGPFDPAANDGRQTLTRGECFVLDRTWLDLPNFMGTGLGSAHPCVFDGGRVWKERLIQSGVATHTLAVGPTLAEFLAAFPEISFVEN